MRVKRFVVATVQDWTFRQMRRLTGERKNNLTVKSWAYRGPTVAEAQMGTPCNVKHILAAQVKACPRICKAQWLGTALSYVNEPHRYQEAQPT
jgi:hypothetical protein